MAIVPVRMRLVGRRRRWASGSYRVRVLAAATVALAALGGSACTSRDGATAPPTAAAPGSTSASAGGGTSPTPTNSTAVPVAAGHLWILTETALKDLVSDPKAASRLRGDTIYEILKPGHQPTPGYEVIPTQSFASYQDFSAAVSSGGIPAYVRAVIYDDEHWQFTPSIEQQNPAKYYEQAAALAHAHGLALLAAPALDLTEVLAPSSRNPVGSFVSAGIPGSAARSADVEDIQAQRLVSQLSAYTAFLSEAAAQARASNPHIVLLAGLSTCAGGFPSPGTLLAAAEASLPYVSGWWLNIPGSGPQAPGCGSPRTDTAIQLLDRLP